MPVAQRTPSASAHKRSRGKRPENTLRGSRPDAMDGAKQDSVRGSRSNGSSVGVTEAKNGNVNPLGLPLCVGEILARRVRHLRIDRGLRQKELETLAGLPKSTLSQIERGHRVPGLETVCKLADALQVSTDLLLGRV